MVCLAGTTRTTLDAAFVSQQQVSCLLSSHVHHQPILSNASLPFWSNQTTLKGPNPHNNNNNDLHCLPCLHPWHKHGTGSSKQSRESFQLIWRSCRHSREILNSWLVSVLHASGQSRCRRITILLDNMSSQNAISSRQLVGRSIASSKMASSTITRFMTRSALSATFPVLGRSSMENSKDPTVADIWTSYCPLFSLDMWTWGGIWSRSSRWHGQQSCSLLLGWVVNWSSLMKSRTLCRLSYLYVTSICDIHYRTCNFDLVCMVILFHETCRSDIMWPAMVCAQFPGIKEAASYSIPSSPCLSCIWNHQR